MYAAAMSLSGSHCSFVVKLFGEEHSTNEIVLMPASDVGLERSSTVRFRITIQERMGPLYALSVRQQLDNERDSWFLEGIKVIHPRTGHFWHFPCNHWFGEGVGSRSEAVYERFLKAASFVPYSHSVKSSDQQDKESGMDVTEITRRKLEAMHRELIDKMSRKDNQATLEKAGYAPMLQWYLGKAAYPHVKKVEEGAKSRVGKDFGWAGEDAYFVLSEGTRNAMGIADGVYEWREHGIDAGLFSRTLMLEAQEAARHSDVRDPLQILREASQQVSNLNVKGSSTCCLAVLDTRKGILHSCSLGDSQLVIVSAEREEVIFRSYQTEHGFGCPAQLGHHASASSADEAWTADVPVSHGDIIVMGSDGLFDNVWVGRAVPYLLCAAYQSCVALAQEDELVDLLLPGLRRIKAHEKDAGPQVAAAAANRLAYCAVKYSLDRKKETPYSMLASQEFNMVYSGGKVDDVTVIVGVVMAVE
eukprot:scaffold336_cov384-Prasinococcus_capsulatus_cf.AAC.10